MVLLLPPTASLARGQLGHGDGVIVVVVVGVGTSSASEFAWISKSESSEPSEADAAFKCVYLTCSLSHSLSLTHSSTQACETVFQNIIPAPTSF